MEKFYLSDYLVSPGKDAGHSGMDFNRLCQKVNEEFLREWEEGKENVDSALRIQKKAIIGYDQEVSYFRSRIRELVKSYGSENEVYPEWYNSLDDGIYHENWGLAGIAEWFSEKYRESSSAKIIGDRIYFLEDGQMRLKPQRIPKDRREQLIRAFLLLTPEERLDKEFHEIYMLDGTRVTIFGGAMTKQGQDVIIFRRYIIPSYSFEEQAARGTIPLESVPLLKAMVDIGFNVAFTGAVRTAKTTFLSTWQSYEDQNLEGVMVETDPEIPLHKMMPDAPILQIIADNDRLKHISKNLLRSDADYFILAEARDGIALDTAVKIASKGTRRMKITFHARDPLEFCYDVAGEIVKSLGGDLGTTAQKVASSFDYIFHFIQLKNKNQKRLKSIYELSLDREMRRIQLKELCRYDTRHHIWKWNNVISKEKKQLAVEENSEAYETFAKELAGLSHEKERIGDDDN
ncbi:CpaF/VirB11 family protein [Sinanaerobacter chloroacetimidivorans]|jgi:pilus assembly protein CpaF|uniref:ATPase n=1 Tax=Sinanaerobacter chloroacetimidivorans TaxID=2818044 RepID=A0A8J8B043_9FIRM|nr:CpaF/VirB11 family protein [Sinanaerobacter chloroacetimidivorans]MBR0596829.1 ATPase [Sinanaerobacter chloroacetimidivorans]